MLRNYTFSGKKGRKTKQFSNFWHIFVKFGPFTGQKGKNPKFLFLQSSHIIIAEDKKIGFGTIGGIKIEKCDFFEKNIDENTILLKFDGKSGPGSRPIIG